MKTILTALTVPIALLAGCNQSATNAAAPGAKVAASAAPAGSDWTAMVVETPEGGVMMGNPKAAVKLVEYGARTCPTCARFSKDGTAPLLGYVKSGKVSFEFRDFPVHGALDVGPIILGHCGGTKPFFAVLEKMMAAQPELLKNEAGLQALAPKLQGMAPAAVATTIADTLGYTKFVEQLGVGPDQAKQCLNDPAQLARIDRTLKVANDKYTISGTPTFIVNDKVLDGVADWKGVEAALRNAGA